MKKIRINELARELEVKAHEILERLPELGVTEKKTHSSSLDEDVAIKLRRLYGVEAPVEEPGEEAAEPDVPAPAAVVEEPTSTSAVVAREMAPPAPEFKPAEEDHVVAEEVRPAAPIRPPLAGGRPVQPP